MMARKGLIPVLLLLITTILTVPGIVGGQDTTALSDSIDDETPFHEIPVVVSEDGSTVTVEMEAIRGNLDPFLYLMDNNGTIIAENDDRAEDDFDSRIVFPQTATGEYTVIATRFGVVRGTSSGTFSLVIQIDEPQTVEDREYGLSDDDLLTAGYPVMEPHPEAEWTVLVYYGGDSSLEANVLNDLDEFERAGGSTEQVRVLALVDRNPAFTDSNQDWSTTRVFEVGADVSGDFDRTEVATIDSQPLADLGNLDTSSGETLAQFLVWAIRAYPAQRYMIALGGHGGAWHGVVADDSSGGKLMPITELSGALRSVREATGIDKFDLIINDACSMGSVEYHNAMAEHAKVALASPEIIVEPALDMTRLVEMLNEQPRISPRELSRSLIDKYIFEDVLARQSVDAAYLNHAAINLENVYLLKDAIEDFAAVINRNPTEYSVLLGQARANTYSYGAFVGDDSQIDLGHFMGQVIAHTTEFEVVTAAMGVVRMIELSRVYGRATPDIETLTTYLSVYYPRSGEQFDPAYLSESGLPEWSRMLRYYYNAITPHVWEADDSLLAYHPPVAPNVVVTQVFPEVASLGFPPTISVELVGRRFAKGAVTVDRIQPDGSLVRLAETEILSEAVVDNVVYYVNNWKSGVDQSFFNLLPLTLPVVSDGETQNNERLTITGEVATLEGRFRQSENDDWRDVSVLFSLGGSVQRIIDQGRGGALANIRIAPGSEFQAYRYSVSADGHALRAPGTTFTWPEGGLTWSQETIETGQYNLGFLVTAFGGRTGFDSVTVTIDNENIQEYLRGYTDVNLGINFQHPAGWNAIADFGNWLQTTNPEGTAALNVYYFQNLDNVFEIVGNAQNRFSFEIEGSAEALHLQDEFGLLFNHTYQTEDGANWRGRAAAFHRRTALGEQGIVFSMDVMEGATTTYSLEELFEILLETIRFFDAETLHQEEPHVWDYQFINQRIPYPVPADWTVDRRDDLWTIFYPPGGEDGLTLAAVAHISGASTGLAGIRNQLMAQFAPDAEHDRRNYLGEYHDWDSSSYQVMRGDVPVVGRIYVTEIDHQFYALRFETPEGDEAVGLFRALFEPMLDGFAPPSTITFAGGGTRTSYVRSAVITANDICGDLQWGEICHGSGTPLRLLDGEGNMTTIAAPGDRVPSDDLLAFQVGTKPDGNIDPFSVAVLNLQANIPDEASEHYVKLIAFGGVTIINRTFLDGGQIHRLQEVNITPEIVNIRNYPYNGFIVDAFQPGQEVTAVAQTEDGAWIRVRLPGNPDETGWVLADLIGSLDGTSESLLKIGNPNRPNLGPMQSLEIYLDESVDDRAALNGVLIQTAPGQDFIDLEINGTLFEIAGGSLVFWRGELGELVTVTEAEQLEAFGETTTRRRPSGWSSAVLSGSVRVQSGAPLRTIPTATGADSLFTLLFGQPQE